VKKGLLLALIFSMTLVVSALAQPAMLSKGKMSVGVTASRQARVNFGWNIADLSKLAFGVGVANTTPQQQVVNGQVVTPDSETTWSFDVMYNKYLAGLSTTEFSPFIGGGVVIEDEGEARDMGWAVEGHFGGEAFVVEPLSLGGYIGVAYRMQGKLKDQPAGTQTVDLDGQKTFTTFTSALTATLYW